jgi:hypothetical protein
MRRQANGSQQDWQIDRRSFMPLLGGGASFLMLAGTAQAQQVPIPTTAAQVPGPPSGTAMNHGLRPVGRTCGLSVGLDAGQHGQPPRGFF